MCGITILSTITPAMQMGPWTSGTIPGTQKLATRG
jgi:hypothetical protein